MGVGNVIVTPWQRLVSKIVFQAENKVMTASALHPHKVFGGVILRWNNSAQRTRAETCGMLKYQL